MNPLTWAAFVAAYNKPAYLLTPADRFTIHLWEIGVVAAVILFMFAWALILDALKTRRRS